MKGIVMEVTGKYAIILTRDGLFKKIKAQPGMTPGVEIDTSMPCKAAPARRPMYRIASIAASILLVLGSGSAVFSYNAPYSYVDFDINPSIGLTANIYDRIIKVEALNEDGSRLIEGRNLKHMTLDQGIMLLLSTAVEQGYLEGEMYDFYENKPDTAEVQEAPDTSDKSPGPQGADPQAPADGQQPKTGTVPAPGGDEAGDVRGRAEDRKDKPGDTAGQSGQAAVNAAGGPGTQPAGDKLKNAVMLTVSSSNAKKTGALKKIVEDTAARELSKGNVEMKILVGETSVKQRETAHKLGVTPGRLVLIEEVSGYFPGADFDKMKNTAVKDLLEMVRDKQESGQLQWFDGEKEDKEKENREKKEDKEKKDKPDAGAAVKGNSGGNAAGGALKNQGTDKDKDKSKGSVSTGVTGSWNIAGGGKNTADDAKPGGSKPGAGQNSGSAGDKGKDGKSAASPGKSADKDKKDEKSAGKDRDNEKKGGAAGKQSNPGKLSSSGNKEKADAKQGLFSWGDVRKVLEKQGEELKKERERLKDEFIRQITGPNTKGSSTSGKSRGDDDDDWDGNSKNSKAKNDKNNTNGINGKNAWNNDKDSKKKNNLPGK